jgi:signal transduction histidine kinase
VHDTGHGIPPLVVDRVFEAFFTTKPERLGMGLSISRSIIEAHDGSLFAPATERGATFRFTLPPSPGAAPA